MKKKTLSMILFIMFAVTLLVPLVQIATSQGSYNRFAVIIAGTSNDTQHYNWFWGATSGMYDILKDRYGYSDANIYFLFEDDHGGDPRVDYTATKSNLQTVFNTLVSTMTSSDTLFCYFVGHGSADGSNSYYDLVGTDLKDTELNTMRQGIQSDTQTFVFSQCQSGHFCNALGKTGTITITSCRIDEYNAAAFAEPIRDALGYLQAADSNGDGQVSFGEAYNYALDKVVEWYQNQGLPLDEHCQIDDNGDGISTYGKVPTDGHGPVALNRFLGPPPYSTDVTFGSTPIIDGLISGGEWADANSVTFSTSGGTCTVYFKHNGASLYVAFDVPNLDTSSGVQIFVDLNFDRASAPQTDDYRFTIARRLPPDEYGENQGTGTDWTPWGSPVGWSGAHQDLASTWNAEFVISYSKLGITRGVAKTIGISFWNCWTSTGDYFWPDGASWVDPSTWGIAYSSDYWGPVDVTYGSTPTVDGTISSGEYTDANSLTFVTSGGMCTVYLKHDGANLYVAFDVPNLDADSAVQIFVDLNFDRASAPQTDDYRFTIARRLPPDEYGENQGTGTDWTPWGSPVGWSGAHQDLASTWNAEFKIPYAKLEITAGVPKIIGISFWNAWTTTGDYHWPAGASWVDPSTWGMVSSSDNWRGGAVGGVVIPVDKFGLLAPYIGLASAILVATVATAIYIKRVKRRREKQ